MKKSKIAYASMTKGEKIWGVIYLIAQIFLPYGMTLGNSYLPTPMSAGTLTFVTYLVSFLLICVIFHQFLRSSLSAAWHDLWNLLQAIVLGVVGYWACSKLLDWLLGILISGYSPILDTSISTLSAANGYLLIIGVVILAPMIDETLYRGLVFRGLWRKSKVWAYILSILIFAAVHSISYIASGDITSFILCFVRYLPAGLCLAWTYSKADNLFAPVVVHAIFNAITIGITV